jgi:hypothetical protein
MPTCIDSCIHRGFLESGHKQQRGMVMVMLMLNKNKDSTTYAVYKAMMKYQWLHVDGSESHICFGPENKLNDVGTIHPSSFQRRCCSHLNSKKDRKYKLF